MLMNTMTSPLLDATLSPRDMLPPVIVLMMAMMPDIFVSSLIRQRHADDIFDA